MDKKLLILVVILLVFTGCQKKTVLVEPSEMSSLIIDTMRSNEEQGVYMIEGSKNQIIIYYGVETGIKTMSSSVTNHVLTLQFETEELAKPQYFTYQVNSSSSFDTIQVSIDGKDEAFHTIFVQ